MSFMSMLQIVSAVYPSYAELEKGKQQEKAANFNAKVMEQNADIARREAQLKAHQVRKEKVQMIGKQRAMIGGSGVTAEGSPLLLLSDTATEYEYDAALETWRGETKAQQFKQKAKYQRKMGKYAKKQAYWQAGSSLLSGLSSSTY